MVEVVYPNRQGTDADGGGSFHSLRGAYGSMQLGRPSAVMNEDDFDYAIELRPDDEYRQAAEILPDIVDFDEIEINPEDIFREFEFDEDFDDFESDAVQQKVPFARQSTSASPYYDEVGEDGTVFQRGLFDVESNHPRKSSIMSSTGFYYTNAITGIGTLPLTHSSPAGKGTRRSSLVSQSAVVSKKEFNIRIKILANHRKWVERATRQSSIGFQNKYHLDDKHTQDKFLVCMARGIVVRRHQAYKNAEEVQLQSTTGCREICWQKPSAADDQTHRGLNRVNSGIIGTKTDRGMFGCCIAICGCGDDLTGLNDRKMPSAPARPNAAPTALSLLCGMCTNFGYKRTGTFADLDIIAVHPATNEDPTAAGMIATDALRASRDVYIPSLTFSVIIEDRMSSLGYSSLDIECDHVEVYWVLLRGFMGLLKESLRRHQGAEGSNHERRASEPGAGEVGNEAGGTAPDNPSQLARSNSCESTNSKGKESMWGMCKTFLTEGRLHQRQGDEAVHDLFAPSYTVDPMRAVRVGGGLLPANRTPIYSPTSLFRHVYKSQSFSAMDGTHNPSAPPPKVPVAQFLGWRSAGTQIWARLKMAGLDVKCVYSWDLCRVILKVRCPNWRLEHMAEQMHIKIKTRGGYIKPFKVSKRDSFTPFGSHGQIFRSSDRQRIIDHIIRSNIQDGGAELDVHTELGSYIVQRFPLHMHMRLAELKHSWVTFWKREPAGVVSPPISPFSSSYAHTLQHWVTGGIFLYNNLLTQPLDGIAEYYGESVAFYFAFMAFYTRWLVFPSVLGVIVFIVQCSTDQIDHWFTLPYAVVVMIWVCFMLAFWRQKQSALAYKWGVLDYEVEEAERPQFQGEYFYDDLTGDLRKAYPMYRRFARYMVTMPAIVMAMGVILVIMATVFDSQDRLYQRYSEREKLDLSPSFPLHAMAHNISAALLAAGEAVASTTSSVTTSANATTSSSHSVELRDFADPEFLSVTFFYPCIYGVLVSILSNVFQSVAFSLNEFENHRTQTTFINRLILKVFSFQFVTIFTSLYYYVFFTADHDAAYMRITSSIFSLMTVGTWWNLVMDTYLPALYHRTLLYRMRTHLATTSRKIYAARELADKEALRCRKAAAQAAAQAAQDLAAAEAGQSPVGPSSPTMARPPHTGPSEEETRLQQQIDKRVHFLDQGRAKCWEEALMLPYNNFTDYTTLVIQLSFVLFFSAIFPLIPLIALVNNVFLLRLQAYKICYTRQRPIAQKCGGIGVWRDVLQVLSMGGVLTNCALFGFVNEPIRALAIPAIGQTGLAIVLFVYEQCILLFKYWLHTQLPSVPWAVRRAQVRERKSISRRSKGREAAARTKSGNGRGGRGSFLVSSVPHAGDGRGADEFRLPPQSEVPEDEDQNEDEEEDEDEDEENPLLRHWAPDAVSNGEREEEEEESEEEKEDIPPDALPPVDLPEWGGAEGSPRYASHHRFHDYDSGDEVSPPPYSPSQSPGAHAPPPRHVRPAQAARSVSPQPREHWDNPVPQQRPRSRSLTAPRSPAPLPLLRVQRPRARTPSPLPRRRSCAGDHPLPDESPLLIPSPLPPLPCSIDRAPSQSDHHELWDTPFDEAESQRLAAAAGQRRHASPAPAALAPATTPSAPSSRSFWPWNRAAGPATQRKGKAKALDLVPLNSRLAHQQQARTAAPASVSAPAPSTPSRLQRGPNQGVSRAAEAAPRRARSSAAAPGIASTPPAAPRYAPHAQVASTHFRTHKPSPLAQQHPTSTQVPFSPTRGSSLTPPVAAGSTSPPKISSGRSTRHLFPPPQRSPFACVTDVGSETHFSPPPQTPRDAENDRRASNRPAASASASARRRSGGGGHHSAQAKPNPFAFAMQRPQRLDFD